MTEIGCVWFSLSLGKLPSLGLSCPTTTQEQLDYIVFNKNWVKNEEKYVSITNENRSENIKY